MTKRKKICPDFTIRKIIYHSFLRRMVARDDPFYLKILSQPAPIGAKSPIMNRYSLVAPQLQHLAKKVQLTLIGSPLSAFQRAQDEYCTLSLSPQRGGGSKTQSVQNLPISCDNSETVRDRMSVSIHIITNRKSHNGFRLIPTSMTLNDFE